MTEWGGKLTFGLAGLSDSYWPIAGRLLLIPQIAMPDSYSTVSPTSVPCRRFPLTESWAAS